MRERIMPVSLAVGYVESSHAGLPSSQPSMALLQGVPWKKGDLAAALLFSYFFSMADSTTMSSTYACDGASAGGFFTS